MDKKHDLYVKSPVYFGFACVIAGMIFSCMEKGKSEEEMKYSHFGGYLCLF